MTKIQTFAHNTKQNLDKSIHSVLLMQQNGKTVRFNYNNATKHITNATQIGHHGIRNGI